MHNVAARAHISLQRVASMESLQDLMLALQDICHLAQMGEQDAQDFRLAVEEACVNIISYAYAGQAIGSIHLDVSWSNDEGVPAIVCTLRDRGVRFNPLDRPLPDVNLPAEERGVGGLGVLLLRQLSDRTQWIHDKALGNCLTLIKYIQPRPIQP
jgi:serine/threonine-protein kinase RsbW